MKNKNNIISIHSLHTEGDKCKIHQELTAQTISIHSLHTEGDVDLIILFILRFPFQSTPSTRRETDFESLFYKTSEHFNPLPPHGGRLMIFTALANAAIFQSTPSTRRETCTAYKILVSTPSHFNPLPPHGGRQQCTNPHFRGIIFQSTPSTRRETMGSISNNHTFHISIHSLHTEGDLDNVSTLHFASHFNPLPPHGGRLSSPPPLLLL